MSEAGSSSSSVSVVSAGSGEGSTPKKDAPAHGPPAKSEISGAVFNLANAVSSSPSARPYKHFAPCALT